MYEAKEAGRNNYRVYDSAHHVALRDEPPPG